MIDVATLGSYMAGFACAYEDLKSGMVSSIFLVLWILFSYVSQIIAGNIAGIIFGIASGCFFAILCALKQFGPADVLSSIASGAFLVHPLQAQIHFFCSGISTVFTKKRSAVPGFLLSQTLMHLTGGWYGGVYF